MTWTLFCVLNLKPSAEKFEEGMTIKMINERIIKTLLKRKIIYSFELIYNHGLVSGITSLSMFLMMRPKNLLLAGLAKYLVLKKCFCFYQKISFRFFLMERFYFRKMLIVLYMERQLSYKIKFESFKLPRSALAV